jgi:protein ImuB
LNLIEGPERIEAGWWDDALVVRDYFIAENETGQLLWIYCERTVAEQNKKGEENKNWYLQGLFG